jgi:hypothetical protein
MQQGKQQPQHQPADGPAFWNITLNFNPGELESDLTKMFFNQALDLHKENEALKQHIKRLEEVGDALCENSNPSRWDLPAAAAQKLVDQSNWHKAKDSQ